MLRYKDYAWRFRTEQWSENDFCNHVMTLHAFVAHACYKKFYKDCILKERIKGLTV